jgi:hypothetical protein
MQTRTLTWELDTGMDIDTDVDMDMDMDMEKGDNRYEKAFLNRILDCSDIGIRNLTRTKFHPGRIKTPK